MESALFIHSPRSRPLQYPILDLISDPIDAAST
jgi:hypothetical protein